MRASPIACRAWQSIAAPGLSASSRRRRPSATAGRRSSGMMMPTCRVCSDVSSVATRDFLPRAHARTRLRDLPDTRLPCCPRPLRRSLPCRCSTAACVDCLPSSPRGSPRRPSRGASPGCWRTATSLQRSASDARRGNSAAACPPCHGWAVQQSARMGCCPCQRGQPFACQPRGREWRRSRSGEAVPCTQGCRRLRLRARRMRAD